MSARGRGGEVVGGQQVCALGRSSKRGAYWVPALTPACPPPCPPASAVYQRQAAPPTPPLSPALALATRPFLYTTYALGGAGFVYAVVKGALFEFTGRWLPEAAVIVTLATFSWLHILGARCVWREDGGGGLPACACRTRGALPNMGCEWRQSAVGGKVLTPLAVCRWYG